MSAWNVVGPLYGFGLCGLVATIYYLMPRLTRPDVYFSVTVPTGFREQPEARATLRRYRRWVLLHTAAALALVLVGTWTRHESLFSIGVLWQTIGSMQAFLVGRRSVAPHAVAPTTKREAALVLRSTTLPGGPIAQLGPFLILAATASYLALHWQNIPSRFAVHWDLSGHPNRWVSRSVSGVFGSLITGAVLCAVMLLLSYGLLHWSRRVQVSGELGRGEQKFRRANLAILLGAEYLMTITFTCIALLPLFTFGPGVFPAVMMLVDLLLVVTVMIVLTRLGQDGNRLSPSGQEAGAPIGDRTSDAQWKWGIFYVNSEDPAIFVKKRFGIGYTMNFGNRWAWGVLVLLLIVPLLTTLLAVR
jgi:uncharacterized membrane protein